MREAQTANHSILDEKNRHLLNVRACVNCGRSLPRRFRPAREWLAAYWTWSLLEIVSFFRVEGCGAAFAC